MSVQNPIRLSANSEPQPDIALLRPRADFYRVARIFRRGEHFASSAVPGLEFDTDAVLG